MHGGWLGSGAEESVHVREERIALMDVASCDKPGVQPACEACCLARKAHAAFEPGISEWDFLGLWPVPMRNGDAPN